MPEQKSTTGRPITTASFESPFESVQTRFGVLGLNINDAIDAVEPNELTRMLNVTHLDSFGVAARPGLTAGPAAGTNRHTIRRLSNPADAGNPHPVFHGIDTSLYYSTTSLGALTSIDSGYSGNPFSTLRYEMPLGGTTASQGVNSPWLIIADSNKMSQARTDGLVLPVGLPAPSTAATAVLGTQYTTGIANFSSDGTAPGSWAATAGFTIPTGDTPSTPVATQAPLIGTVTDDLGNAGMAVVVRAPLGTPIAGSPDPFYNIVGVARTMDLSKVGGLDAEDADYITFRLRFANTFAINEVRIYFVCSATFDPTVVPGRGAPAVSTSAIPNSDFFYASFQPQGIAGALNAGQTLTVGLTQQAQQDLTNSSRRSGAGSASTGQTAIPRTIPAGTSILQTGPGSLQWQTFGTQDVPARRGDFVRVGETQGRDWNTITGIVIYIQANKNVDITGIQISDLFMQGGAGPDTGDPTSTPYDYRYTHFDNFTGAEGNPSPIMATNTFPSTLWANPGLAPEYPANEIGINSLRRPIVVTPTAYGNGHTIQRFYRRGGTLPTDWFFVGANTSDGGTFTDTVDDTQAAASATVETDNYQPVPTVNTAGVTVLAQPLTSIWGPLEDLIMGCGDPYRPGHVYFSKPGNVESWPVENNTEVCAASEKLMAGCLYGGQSFVFSQERMFVLYPNLSGEGTTLTSTVTQCKRGLISRLGLVVGLGGMYFVSQDGVYKTVGAAPEWLSKKIDPIFKGITKNGIAPINLDATDECRLEIWQNQLFFRYKDTNGSVQVFVYHLLLNFWRVYNFATGISAIYAEEDDPAGVLLLGGLTSGKAYSHTGTSDDGTAISCQLRTGALTFDRPRQEKRLGDQVLDFDSKGVDITVQNLYNYDATSGTAMTGNVTPRGRNIFSAFGTTPIRAETISTDISWSSASASPEMFWNAVSVILEPDITTNRVTQWDDLGHGDDSWLMGVTFDCDTGGGDRTVLVEVDFNGATSTAATLTVNCNGRHKQKFSWPGVRANKVRVRPANSTCADWQLFKVDWIFQPEPPIISKWDSYFENAWDQYYTGLDLFCDTFGLDKTVEVYVDGTLIKTQTVNTNGRQVFHITLPWGRGHVLRFIATDANPGQLYDHRWHTEAEPSEQTNWNAPFTVAGGENGKWLKAVVLQMDSFGQNKTVTVEVDGVVVETLTVNTSGRKVVQRAFPRHLGNVFRVIPTDNNPSRLYSMWLVFDSDPLFLDRWETEELDFGLAGWSYVTYAHVTLRSTADVTLEHITFNQSGETTTKTYVIPSTAGTKSKTFLPFQAVKGIMHRFILTSDDAFALYRPETDVFVRAWGTDQTAVVHPFGDDDTETRGMVKAALAEARGNYATDSQA